MQIMFIEVSHCFWITALLILYPITEKQIFCFVLRNPYTYTNFSAYVLLSEFQIFGLLASISTTVNRFGFGNKITIKSTLVSVFPPHNSWGWQVRMGKQ